jgi:hypothetical protein
MYKPLTRYPWVMKLVEYESTNHLISIIDEAILQPLEAYQSSNEP